MREVALVFDYSGRPIHWVDGASGVVIPDSKSLWDVIWKNKAVIGGVAHTHPWRGETQPSGTDLSTFSAIDRALGRHLNWPIITLTHDQYFRYCSDESAYLELFCPVELRYGQWENNIVELRRRSHEGEEHG